MRRLWLLPLVLLIAALGQSVALGQTELTPPTFGPYEAMRRQAHAQCQGALAQGNAQGYLMCMAQVAANPMFCSGGDFLSFQWCTAALSTPYPAPAQPVLTARSYRVEVAGGVQRERDPSTNTVLRETRVPPSLLFTLERQANGLYRGVTYGQGGQPQSTYWVDDRCEITDAQGNPAMDGWRCPLYPGKPYLVNLLPPPSQGFAPSAQVYSGGRLADDFDGDGVVEVGYLRTGGSSGQAGGGWATGYAHALGYDPNTLMLKFEYLLFGNQGQGAPSTWLTESLVYFRVEAR